MTKNKIVTFSALCTLVQYYDYYLFGLLAVKISQCIFPDSNAMIQLLKSYFLLFVSVLAKPIGAIYLGKIGDIYGRHVTIKISLVLCAISSIMIGITPCYNVIGSLSIVIVIISRMIVVACASSGTDGMRIYVYELIGKKQKGLGVSITSCASIFGASLCSFVIYIFTLNKFPPWTWRIVFIVGGIMTISMYFIQCKFFNNLSNHLQQEKDYKQNKDISLFKIIKQYLSIFIKCSILAGCIGGSYHFIFIFWGTYNFQILKIVNHSSMYLYSSLGAVLYIIFSFIAGMLSDKIGIRKSLIIGFVPLISVITINTILIAQNKFSPLLYCLIFVFLPFITMNGLLTFKGVIPAVVRHRLFSISHSIGSIAISASISFISMLIYYKTHIKWLPMLYFLVLILLMFFIINTFLKNENTKTSLKHNQSNCSW